MHAMKCVFGYLLHNSDFSIHYDLTKPDFSGHKIEVYDWFPLYRTTSEEMSYGAPEPKGKGVVMWGYLILLLQVV